MNRSIDFHWALPVDAKSDGRESQKDRSGEIDMEKLIHFVKLADKSPVKSLLTPFGFHMPDPFPLLGMLSSHAKRVQFLLAYRPGLMSPTLFAQQMATLSQILPGRLNLNIVAGFSPEEQSYYGDHLSHDERFARSQEFMDIAISLWEQKSPVNFKGDYFDIREARINTQFIGKRPKIYLSGNSKVAQSQAAQQADCWLRYGDLPEKIAEQRAQLGANAPKSLGLRLSLVAARTQSEAFELAARVVANPDQNWKNFLKNFIERCDSQAIKGTYALSEREWLSETLWTGAVPFRGGPALAIVGSYDQVAQELLRFWDCGVSEFILSGWPTELELQKFSEEVHPRILELLQSREREMQYA